MLAHEGSLAYAPWPTYDEKMCEVTSVTMGVQVNGKVRGADEAAGLLALHQRLACDGAAIKLDGEMILLEWVDLQLEDDAASRARICDVHRCLFTERGRLVDRYHSSVLEDQEVR